MSTEKKYIDGIFIQERENQYGDFLSFGITDEGIDLLKSLPKNEKGIRNFAAFRRKDNNKKYSPMWPKNTSAPASAPDRGNEGKDDLPF